jgi:poly-gamma-glutamate synthesis protein (capsule biosynthesis protein)
MIDISPEIDSQASLVSLVEEDKNIEKEVKPEKILFVGDMMFDRGVESLMIKKSFSYPIELIKNFLNDFDFVVGNLEGPINNEPQDFPDSSLKFSFDKRIIGTLKSGNFSLVSLANNHTLNTGSSGLKETREILEEAEINYAGDTIDCDMDYVYQKDGITFYAINKTFPSNCSNEEVSIWIDGQRFYNPESFFIVLIHWGNEYEEVNSLAQQKLAHLMIDSGADLVIGGHPHVVQNIEKYNGKLIFYSLGNFIFDQYFSKETQESLALGLEIYPNKKIYNLYPTKSTLSQPQLMDKEEKEVFLETLSSNSSDDLKEAIKKGYIEN